VNGNKAFCRVLISKLKALFDARNQSAVAFWWVMVGKGYSELETWRRRRESNG